MCCPKKFIYILSRTKSVSSSMAAYLVTVSSVETLLRKVDSCLFSEAFCLSLLGEGKRRQKGIVLCLLLRKYIHFPSPQKP